MWIYDDPPSDEYEKKVRSFLEKFLKNKVIAEKSSRTLGLYKYLSEKSWKDSAEIYNSVYLDKEKRKHFFGKKDAKVIFDNLTQKGGEKLKPYDALVMRWLSFMYFLSPDPIQSMIRYVEPFAFPLRTVEDDLPVAGDMIGLSIDMAAETNKVLAKSAQQYTPIIMGFLPIPEASTVGLVIGYLISTMFIFFNMAIYVSRKHLGEAFTQSFALIPLAGMGIQNALESGDRVLEKVSEKRRRIIDKVKGSIPALGNFLEFVVFDPDYQGNPEEDAAALKARFSEITANVGSKITELKNQVKSEEGRASLLANAKTGIADLGARVNTPDVQNYISKANDTLAPKAGKRLSKNHHKKSKWGTQKRSRK
jgi:hypothetical protein